MPGPWIIASRRSPLAMAQTRLVADRLRRLGDESRVEGLSTPGDEITDRPLSDIGGKERFVNRLRVALQTREADIAVHSLKDMAAADNENFALAAVGFSEDARDAFVSNHFAALSEMPANAVVGTSSPRRTMLIRHYHPHLRVNPMRGNLATRLAKMDGGDCDALILAAAGLRRLNLQNRIAAVLSPARFVPAAGQGLLAAECLVGRDNVQRRLQLLDNRQARRRAAAERAFAAAMQGDCATPLGAHATVEKERVLLKVFYATKDGECFFAWADDECPATAGKRAASKILAAVG